MMNSKKKFFFFGFHFWFSRGILCNDGYLVDYAASMPSLFKASSLHSRFSLLISAVRKKFGHDIDRNVRRQINANFKRYSLACGM